MAQPQLDFSHVTLEEFERNDTAPEDLRRLFWCTDESNAWHKERARKYEAKREEQERVERERAAERNAIKNAMAYSEAAAQEICERISVGELLIDICDEENMPTMRRCNQWLKQHSEFQALYRDSINDRLNVFEEAVIRIADDMKQDFKTIVKNGKERRVHDPDMIARAKLRIEVRFKHLKAMRPQKWGEQSTISVKNEDEFDPASMSAIELEQTIADIMKKERVVRAA
jgi:hypothetical protein